MPGPGESPTVVKQIEKSSEPKDLGPADGIWFEADRVRRETALPPVFGKECRQ